MKTNRLLLLSAGLNLVLAGAIGYLFFAYSARAPIGAKSVSSPPPAPAKFHWRQLESEDFSTYIANLRGVGCPEQTVRNIVTAEVAAQFEEERQEIAARPATTEAARQQRRQLLDRLPREQQAVVAGLLGNPAGGALPAAGSLASNAGRSAGQPAYANSTSSGNAGPATAPSANSGEPFGFPADGDFSNSPAGFCRCGDRTEPKWPHPSRLDDGPVARRPIIPGEVWDGGLSGAQPRGRPPERDPVNPKSLRERMISAEVVAGNFLKHPVLSGRYNRMPTGRGGIP